MVIAVIGANVAQEAAFRERCRTVLRCRVFFYRTVGDVPRDISLDYVLLSRPASAEQALARWSGGVMGPIHGRGEDTGVFLILHRGIMNAWVAWDWWVILQLIELPPTFHHRV